MLLFIIKKLYKILKTILKFIIKKLFYRVIELINQYMFWYIDYLINLKIIFLYNKD